VPTRLCIEFPFCKILPSAADFGVRSASEFNRFQPNSLRNGTGNFFGGTGNLSAANREAAKSGRREDVMANTSAS
jgi:hypothetical protein